MSVIKFSFEGDPEVLRQMLSGLAPGVKAKTLTPRSVPTSAPTLEPLHVDPVYDAEGVGGMGESNLAPTLYPPTQPEVYGDFDFASLKLEDGAWSDFSALVKAWLVGFDCPLDDDGLPIIEQPDRLTVLKNVGSGRWAVHILRWCAHYGSLQGAIFQVFQADPPETDDLIDLVDRLSANISQVAHASFPDIVGFHDHSTKWRRELAS